MYIYIMLYRDDRLMQHGYAIVYLKFGSDVNAF